MEITKEKLFQYLNNYINSWIEDETMYISIKNNFHFNRWLKEYQKSFNNTNDVYYFSYEENDDYYSIQIELIKPNINNNIEPEGYGEDKCVIALIDGFDFDGYYTE